MARVTHYEVNDRSPFEYVKEHRQKKAIANIEAAETVNEVISGIMRAYIPTNDYRVIVDSVTVTGVTPTYNCILAHWHEGLKGQYWHSIGKIKFQMR